MTMAIELLTWHAAATKPAAGITVLCWGTDGFFTGWWDAEIESWIGCESGGSVLGVSHWADPDGPDGPDGLKDAGVAWKPKDILDRLAESSPNESSHELYWRCRDARDEVERLRAALKQHDAWLSQAHVLCGDLGVSDGHIEDRLFEAIGKVRDDTQAVGPARSDGPTRAQG